MLPGPQRKNKQTAGVGSIVWVVGNRGSILMRLYLRPQVPGIYSAVASVKFVNKWWFGNAAR